MSKKESALTPRLAMRKSYSRCGWATLSVVLFSSFCAVLLSVLGEIPALKEQIAPVLGEYFLYANEAIIGVGILLGLLVLRGVQAEAPTRTRMPFSFYFCIFAVAVAASTVGNIFGTLWTAPIDMVLGDEMSDSITALLDGQSPLALVLCVGVLAPVFEEFFFRKLLIDRMRPHGEFLAALSSALLFALFHQNVEQYFYTFAVGILLAYLYLRTGSYLAVTLMHAAFNLLLGVLPTLVLAKVDAFFLLLEEGITEELIKALPSLLAEYALPLLGFGLQLLLVSTLTLTGIIIFILFVKKVKLQPPPATLSVWDMGTNAYINGGMLTALLLLFSGTVFSLLL